MKTYNLPELVFNIAELYHKPNGSIEKFHLNVNLPFIDEKGTIIPHSALEGNFMLVKTKTSIECVLEKLTMDTEVFCDKCAKPFIHALKIVNTERSFYLDPKFRETGDDLIINKKDLTLDANDLIRQEIILHFPIVLVCSLGCKGICAYCGQDKNLKKCSCKEPKIEEKTPLAALKDIWKS